MLKNNDLRREFILNDSNWKQIDVIESLKIRVLELKLNSDWGCGRYYRMVDGLLITGSCMHINKAVEVVKNTEEDK